MHSSFGNKLGAVVRLKMPPTGHSAYVGTNHCPRFYLKMTTKHDEQAERAFADAIERLKQKDFEGALTSLQETVSREPAYEQAWEELSTVIQYLGDGTEAERVFARARDMEIESNRFWYTLAQSLQAAKAQESYRFALQANPDDEQSLLELAWSFRTSGDRESAGKLYRYLLSVYVERRDWRALNSLGDTLRRLVGNLDDAEEALRQSLEIRPDNFDAWKNMCYLMCSLRNPAAAQQTIRRFIQSYPDHPRQAEAWVCLGNVLRGFDDLKGAEEAVRQALKVDPDCQAAWSKLADIRFECGDFQEGQQALQRANELDYNKKFDEV